MGLLSGLLAAVLVVISAWLALVAVLWLHRPSRDRVAPLLRLVPEVIRLVRALLADSATPRSVKVALWGLFLYLVSPIDVVPDFLPVIGSLDDLIVSGLILRWAGRRIGTDGLRSHWAGSEEGFVLLRRLLGLA